ncbi:mitochondrial 37S ribosomal protein rsm10 [Friedmanniomyces endolithicus]|nr:mitochondrial 37S ribosomal protein rsm10 [Friedmanniomyces endolithicus]KAK1821551.1 mitochondrial 37S ribosomal protein rsm10 [Friedmanniomyces endolithicus]
MATPAYARSLVNLTKRLKLSPNGTTPIQSRQAPVMGNAQQRRHESALPLAQTASQLDHTPGAARALPPRSTPIDPSTIQQELAQIRLPRAVQATYLDPLRHRSTHNIKTCELQIRSYSVRNLEVFADFAMRAAYYLKLPAKGPKPLPRITERWTVPRSNFVHKKSQENFERITLRRGIEVFDGHAETVAAWLGFLKKRQYYGVGMKANVWEYGGLEVAKDMDAEAERIAESLGEQLDLVYGRRGLMSKEEEVQEMLEVEPFKAQWGAYAAMGGSQSVPNADKRVVTKTVGDDRTRPVPGRVRPTARTASGQDN